MSEPPGSLERTPPTPLGHDGAVPLGPFGDAEVDNFRYPPKTWQDIRRGYVAPRDKCCGRLVIVDASPGQPLEHATNALGLPGTAAPRLCAVDARPHELTWVKVPHEDFRRSGFIVDETDEGPRFPDEPHRGPGNEVKMCSMCAFGYNRELEQVRGCRRCDDRLSPLVEVRVPGYDLSGMCGSCACRHVADDVCRRSELRVEAALTDCQTEARETIEYERRMRDIVMFHFLETCKQVRSLPSVASMGVIAAGRERSDVPLYASVSNVPAWQRSLAAGAIGDPKDRGPSGPVRFMAGHDDPEDKPPRMRRWCAHMAGWFGTGERGAREELKCAATSARIWLPPLDAVDGAPPLPSQPLNRFATWEESPSETEEDRELFEGDAERTHRADHPSLYSHEDADGGASGDAASGRCAGTAPPARKMPRLE